MTKKQRQKPGKVIRVDPETWRLVSAQRGPKETIVSAVRRLLGLNDQTTKRYVLPSDLSESIEEARGRAVLRSVKKKIKPERPIAVRIDP